MLARSLLFVPANRDNMVAKAAGVAADVITLDLEDSVPDAEKEATRGKLEAAIRSLKDAGKTVHVRINALETGLAQDDLKAAIMPGLDGLCFPKPTAASDIRELDVMIRQQEMHARVRPGTVALIPQIESARRIIAAFDEAVREGHASVSVDGQMVDVPVVKRAQELLKVAASMGLG
jgi:citrate lyase subunit beta/citryl-CoA lyase